jgi:hypothetical protein
MKPLAFSRLEAAGKRLLGSTPNPDFEKAIGNEGTPLTSTTGRRV